MLKCSESSSSDSEVKLRQNAQRNIATQLQSLSKQMRFQQQHYVSGELIDVILILLFIETFLIQLS